MRFSQQGEVLRVLTPAKINLSLRILGRRPDGYHDLQTLMVSVGLSDVLQFSPAPFPEVSLRLFSGLPGAAQIPVDDRNLILKAARLLQQEMSPRQGVEITLWKRIPSEAGLGGGSSDAAATLMALNRYWRLNLPSNRLHELAAKLGSDVNFFLDSPPAAFCTGRGEKINAWSLPRPLHVVIIKPPFGLSTGRVFQAWGKRESHENSTNHQPDNDPFQQFRVCHPPSKGVRKLQSLLQNDLEPPARTMTPDLEELLSRLNHLDVIGSGMTGSGSACFALCRTARQARTIAGRCRNWRVGQVFVVSSGV